MCLLVLECIGNIAFFGLQPWYRRVGDSVKVNSLEPGERGPGFDPRRLPFLHLSAGLFLFWHPVKVWYPQYLCGVHRTEAVGMGLERR